jgi:periplasmic divalent cation tolerance protein
MSGQSNVLLVFVTAANPEQAAKISESAVESHQAACATTIQNVHSMYWWEGKLVKDQESVVMLKTTSDRFEALQQTIMAIHTYKVPEIIAIPVVNGLPQYLAWIEEETARYGGS